MGEKEERGGKQRGEATDPSSPRRRVENTKERHEDRESGVETEAE